MESLYSQRDLFPRLYLLSDVDLVQFLSLLNWTARESRLGEAERFMKEMFSNVAKLVWDRDGNMSLKAVVSPEGETLELQKDVLQYDQSQGKGELADGWMQRVENAMDATLRWQLQSALTDAGEGFLVTPSDDIDLVAPDFAGYDDPGEHILSQV